MHRGRHARSGARARARGRDRHAGGRQIGRPRDLEHRAPRRACLSPRLQSSASTGLERPMTDIVLHPRPTSSAECPAIYRGGASGDLAPLVHMAAAMIGVGEAWFEGARIPASEALARAGLAPVALGPKEGLALLNGTQFSTAHALAALFEAERLFQSALLSGALSTDAARGSDAPFDPRIHTLPGHRGQIEAAAALRALMAGSPIRASPPIRDERVHDPYCPRRHPQATGASPR